MEQDTCFIHEIVDGSQSYFAMRASRYVSTWRKHLGDEIGKDNLVQREHNGKVFWLVPAQYVSQAIAVSKIYFKKNIVIERPSFLDGRKAFLTTPLEMSVAAALEGSTYYGTPSQPDLPNTSEFSPPKEIYSSTLRVLGVKCTDCEEGQGVVYLGNAETEYEFRTSRDTMLEFGRRMYSHVKITIADE